MSASRGRILIDAFEPFKLAPTTLVFGNRREKLVERLRAVRCSVYEYLILPVGVESTNILDQSLARRPKAILILGQDLPAVLGSSGTHLELGATYNNQFIESAFVREATREGGALENVSWPALDRLIRM